MICPNCGEEMENRSRCGGLDDDDMGGPRAREKTIENPCSFSFSGI